RPMLRMFKIEGAVLREDSAQSEDRKNVISNAVWIDAHEPSEEEREELNTFLRAELPETDDVDEIEFSARYFQDSDGILAQSLFLDPGEACRHSTATVAYILQDKRLLTVREGDLAYLRLLRMRARRGQVQVSSPQDLMLTMFEQKVEN